MSAEDAKKAGGDTKPDVADSIKGKAANLQKAKTTDSLKKALKSRPSAADAKEAGVVKSTNTDVSNKLAGVANKLEKAITKNNVAHALDQRPDIDELADLGIIPDTTVAPMLQGMAAKLERSMNTNTVNHLLETRPQVHDLHAAGIHHGDAVAASIAGVTEKLEKKVRPQTLFVLGWCVVVYGVWCLVFGISYAQLPNPLHYKPEHTIHAEATYPLYHPNTVLFAGIPRPRRKWTMLIQCD